MVRLLQVMLRFYHHESCGQCTPCREGMGWMHRIIDRIVAGEGRPEDIDQLYQISKLERRHDDLRHGRRRRLRDGRHPQQVPRRVRVLHRAQALAARRQSRGRRRMPEIFINGQPVQAADDQTVLQAALRERLLHPVLLLAPEAVGRRQLPHLRRAGRRAGAGSRSPATCRSPKGLRVLTDSDLVRAHRKAMMQFITLNHPVDCGICDKAGECTLQDYHYAYNGAPSISHEPKVRVDQVPRAVRAHRARQRALHPVLALRALHARDLEVQRARHQAPRRRVAGPRRRGRRARPRPVLGQRHRHLPGRRAAVAAVPAQGARLVPEADAVGVPGLRARLHGQPVAPQAGVEAAARSTRSRTSASRA